ncbi:MAG TPA: UDP-N-acetylmuramate dehydrogenase [Myxococcota bacterium]|nr:UDP-N-acetylmuramate dehydrogenase [Myxococcota bacterium]
MISSAARRALEAALGEGVRFDVPLARHTSLRIGGPADAFAAPADRDELARVLALCARHGVPHTVLGNGFNTLVLDGGIDGLVLSLSRFRGLEELPGPRLRAEAGVSHATITRRCIERGLAGLEFGAGIPGTMGGWTAMNAGIHEREVKDAVVEAEVMRGDGSALETLSAAALEFRYRAAAGLPPGAVVVSTLFALRASTREAVSAEVERHLSRRTATQPLDIPSCGSVFKNPTGDFAGRLIEAAGLKGARVGGAEISTVHANFIVNRGGAKAADVVALVELARGRVRDATGVLLDPEVRIVGRKA